MDLVSEGSIGACPPLTMIPLVVMQLLKLKVHTTIVVSDWANQPWHVNDVMLREKAVAREELKWHSYIPVMLDVSDRKNSHPHLVDKWDFVAFAVGDIELVSELLAVPMRSLASVVLPRKRTLGLQT